MLTAQESSRGRSDDKLCLSGIRPPTGIRTTMLYDKENRLIWHKTGAAVNTMTYDGDGLKRNEIAGSGRTTLVWDATDYLQARTL